MSLDFDPRLILGAGMGLWLFWRGFKKLKLKLLISGIATSKARSMAMGTVELFGSAAPYYPLNDPVYKLPCVFYKLEIKKQQGSGNNSKWVTIYKDSSESLPFYVADETGKALVLAAGAELYCDKDINVTSNLLTSLLVKVDDPISSFLSRFGGGFGNLNLTAYILREYEPVYVLGYAAPLDDPWTFSEKIAQKARLALQEAVQRLKSDPEKMKELDANKDGAVDTQEWDRALAQIKQDLAGKESMRAGPDLTVLVRKSPEGLLILSDKPEEELLSKVGWLAWLQIIGGAALANACAAYLGCQMRWY